MQDQGGERPGGEGPGARVGKRWRMHASPTRVAAAGEYLCPSRTVVKWRGFVLSLRWSLTRDLLSERTERVATPVLAEESRGYNVIGDQNWFVAHASGPRAGVLLDRTRRQERRPSTRLRAALSIAEGPQCGNARVSSSRQRSRPVGALVTSLGSRRPSAGNRVAPSEGAVHGPLRRRCRRPPGTPLRTS